MFNKFTKIIKIFNFLSKIIRNPNHYFEIAKSQNNDEESKYLNSIKGHFQNKSFLEIGFHYYSFNCLSLMNDNFKGVLIDAGKLSNIFIMKFIGLILKKKLSVRNIFIDTDNIKKIIYKKKFGLISIDIDGNDYWILKEILKNKNYPEMFILEYNPSFLDKSITTVYEKNFDRNKSDRSSLYHGASLHAFYKLLKQHNYYLVKVIGGVNAFFVNSEFLNNSKLKNYEPVDIYEEGYLRNKWSNSTAAQQFDKIKHLPFIEV